MLRLCGRLRSLVSAGGGGASSSYSSSSKLRLFSSVREIPSPVGRSALLETNLPEHITRQWKEQMISRDRPVIFAPFQLFQKRNFASKDRSRARDTPITSKVKKTKIKGYSSFKSRFRIMNDGNIRRWRAGKRHNAHLKSKKAKRRLRRPEIVTLAYAKVMKKLNFRA